jgi:hypothetical protein
VNTKEAPTAECHISLYDDPHNDDSVNIKIHGEKLAVVFRLGENTVERLFTPDEAVKDGQRIAKGYQRELNLSREVGEEFGRCLKECGQRLLRQA